MAVAPGYQDTYKTYPTLGRFFTPSDDQTRRKVCVIGEKTRTALRLPRDPVGAFINIKGSWFKVVGLMESRGELFGVSQDDYVLIPFATGEALLTTSDRQDISIAMNLRASADMDLISDRIINLLRQYHNLKKGQESDFTVMTARQLSASFGRITGLLTLVLAGMMSISLIVGGIGIMNIMLASVNERIREIGICKSLGAQRHHILLQFLFESSIIATLGGVAGALVGLTVSWAVTWAFPAIGPFVFPMWTVLAAIGFSLLIGLFFGVAPAAQAASLNPIDALRRE
jgi:putative ABC transport system permease protein